MRDFYEELHKDVGKVIAALEVRYVTERNPVEKTRINHLLRRMYGVKEDIDNALEEVWE